MERSKYAKAVDERTHRLLHDRQKYLYRQCIIEHVFGTIKRQWGMDHILMKGLEKNNVEFGFIYFCCNFKRTMNILGMKELKKRLKRLFLDILSLIASIPANRIPANIFFCHAPPCISD
mgnify:CR=1 FL=1|jgi:hypothetical protein